MNEPLKSTRKCAVCRKEFIFHRGAGWLYKRVKDQKTIYFCSWKCQRLVEMGEVTIQEDSVADDMPVLWKRFFVCSV